MKDPVSRLEKNNELEDRWDWMWEAFLRVLEMKFRFEIGRKLLRSSVDRDGSVDQWIEVVFWKEAGQELVWMTKKFLQKERDWQCLWGLDQGSKFEGFWWRIVLMGFQGVQGLAYNLWFMGFQGVRALAFDSVTRLEKRIRLWKWGIWLSCIRLGISCEVKGRLPTTPTSLKSVDYVPPLSMDNSFGFD